MSHTRNITGSLDNTDGNNNWSSRRALQSRRQAFANSLIYLKAVAKAKSKDESSNSPTGLTNADDFELLCLLMWA